MYTARTSRLAKRNFSATKRKDLQATKGNVVGFRHTAFHNCSGGPMTAGDLAAQEIVGAYRAPLQLGVSNPEFSERCEELKSCAVILPCDARS